MYYISEISIDYYWDNFSNHNRLSVVQEEYFVYLLIQIFKYLFISCIYFVEINEFQFQGTRENRNASVRAGREATQHTQSPRGN